MNAAEASLRPSSRVHAAASTVAGACGTLSPRTSTISSRRRCVSFTKAGSIDHVHRARARERHHAVVDDAAGARAHHGDAVGQIAGLAQVVRDQDDGRLPRHPELLHDRPQLLARELVERAERLVEQQELRIVHQRAAERGALQHAAGELPGIFVAEAREPDLRQQRVGAVAEFGVALGAILLPERRHDLQRQHHVVADRQPRQHRGVLERDADADRLGAELAPRHIDVAARRRDQPADELQDRRLAAAGRADQRDEIALADAQIGLVERRDRVLGVASIGNGDIFQLDEIIIVHAALSVGRAGTRVMDCIVWSALRGAGRRHALDGVDGAAVAARAFDQRAVAHHEAAAHEGVDRQALHLAAVPRRDLRARLQLGVVDRPLARKVDHRDVGLGAGRDRRPCAGRGRRSSRAWRPTSPRSP